MRAAGLMLVALTMAGCETSPPDGGSEAGAPPVASAVACSDLRALADPTIPPGKPVEITIAEAVAAGAFTPPHPDPFGAPLDYATLPAFCRVAGSIRPTADSDIRFELWLPADWNGRFLQAGNGGAAGSIVYGALAWPLGRGYAVAHTDTGHQGGAGEFAWVQGHPERLVDYQYRAVHLLTVVGKAITQAHYGRAPEKSYWAGCSTGGRQGLKEAQKYPEDYDAIIAGAPANNWSPLMALSILIQRDLAPPGLAVAKLGWLREAAIAACDAGDGVTDRVIAQPAECAFDPASLECSATSGEQCLTPTEVAAARRIYAGVVNAAGETLMPGTGPGSEGEWAAYASEGFGIGTSYYRHVIVQDAGWEPASFDVDRDLARAEAFDAGAAKAMDPDLSAFVGRGGKLLIYHGTTDGLIPYGNSVNYYGSVVARLGAQAVKDSVKLYLVPGMNHCAGGEGAFDVDWLGAMERWAEQGDTPDVLVANHPVDAAGEGAFTRPVCPWPEFARYDGDGDATAHASFDCVAP